MGAGFLLPAPPPSHSGKEEESDNTTTATGSTAAAAAAAAAMGHFFAAPNGFGTPGINGSFGYCDPEAGIAYAYVMNRLWQVMIDDPRELSFTNRSVVG